MIKTRQMAIIIMHSITLPISIKELPMVLLLRGLFSMRRRTTKKKTPSISMRMKFMHSEMDMVTAGSFSFNV
jgi:hypothetical protein